MPMEIALREGGQKSGPNGDRTHDLQIISLALYQLSYRTNLASKLPITLLICVLAHQISLSHDGS